MLTKPKQRSAKRGEPAPPNKARRAGGREEEPELGIPRGEQIGQAALNHPGMQDRNDQQQGNGHATIADQPQAGGKGDLQQAEEVAS